MDSRDLSGTFVSKVKVRHDRIAAIFVYAIDCHCAQLSFAEFCSEHWAESFSEE